MPCPCCGEDPEGTTWKPDPLQWDLDPPCTQPEWDYLAIQSGAPEHMTEGNREVAYMNNICRGCFNIRQQIRDKVQKVIREKGGLEEKGPTQKMKKEYEEKHKFDIRANRSARIDGLTSAAAKGLNGQYCKLLKKDPETERWTVELVDGTQKSIKETNITCDNEIDQAHLMECFKFFKKNPSAANKIAEEKKKDQRPLGENTTWEKVKGIHPGAVVRLKGLNGAAHLNGRKGRCLQFDTESGRWTVDLGDERKSLKVENLTPAPGEKPPTLESALKEKGQASSEAERRSKMDASQIHAEEYGWDG
mmetsp:Transcript_61704/g.139221  ORF Transcript_61704/g.139221 Transcript_61704/m.139221 type:complete len:305 (+) Transcript_61704:111-1025(+)